MFIHLHFPLSLFKDFFLKLQNSPSDEWKGQRERESRLGDETGTSQSAPSIVSFCGKLVQIWRCFPPLEPDPVEEKVGLYWTQQGWFWTSSPAVTSLFTQRLNLEKGGKMYPPGWGSTTFTCDYAFLFVCATAFLKIFNCKCLIHTGLGTSNFGMKNRRNIWKLLLFLKKPPTYLTSLIPGFLENDIGITVADPEKWISNK